MKNVPVYSNRLILALHYSIYILFTALGVFLMLKGYDFITIKDAKINVDFEFGTFKTKITDVTVGVGCFIVGSIVLCLSLWRIGSVTFAPRLGVQKDSISPIK